MVIPQKILTSDVSMRDPACPFCEIMRTRQGAVIVVEWTDCVAFEPIDPVVDGHVLVVPRWHVTDASVSSVLSGVVMERACELGRSMGEFNVITSVGSAATQTISHLHLHVVPRCEDDGLMLPWSKR